MHIVVCMRDGSRRQHHRQVAILSYGSRLRLLIASVTASHFISDTLCMSDAMGPRGGMMAVGGYAGLILLHLAGLHN
jgi:hypothetical protein